MALHGQIHVNGRTIGRWSVQRIVTGFDNVHTYRWEAVDHDGRRVTGELRHPYADGAMVLAQKVLMAAHAELAADEPVVADDAAPVRWDAQMRADAQARLDEQMAEGVRVWHAPKSQSDMSPRCGARPEVLPDGRSPGVTVVDSEELITCPDCFEIPPGDDPLVARIEAAIERDYRRGGKMPGDPELQHNAPEWLKSLLKRLREAEVEVQAWKTNAAVNHQQRNAAETALARAEATLARVKAALDEHPGNKRNSAVKLVARIWRAINNLPEPKRLP